MTPERTTSVARRRPSIETVVVLGFSAALLVLAFIGIISYRSMTVFLDTTRAVERSHVVLRELDRVPAHIAEAEAGTRGFVITGNREYLSTYGTARSELARLLREMRVGLADSLERARFEALAGLVTRRLNVSRRTVELSERGAGDSAIALVRSGAGKALSDTIRGLIADIERVERARLEASAARERDAAGEVRLVTSLGFLLAILLSIGATVVVRRDITERRRAERATLEAKEVAEAANRAKSDFLARMSHELRTPLNSVIGFSNVLLKNKGGNLRPQDITYVQRIEAAGEHLLTLINDVLDLSRVEAGRMKVGREPVALGGLIHDLVSSFESQVHGDVSLQAVLPEGLARIDSDPLRLHQILANLVANAVKFTDLGSVTIAVTADPDSGRPVRIDVADTGIGIAADRQAAIFGAFEQADITTTRRFGGTGLGLAISRSLCELLGYQLELAWSEPGRGSVFSIRLDPDAPRYSGGAPAPPAELADRA